MTMDPTRCRYPDRARFPRCPLASDFGTLRGRPKLDPAHLASIKLSPSGGSGTTRGAPAHDRGESPPMAIHLTPTELARESGLERREVIVKCMELGVPIFQGRIDKTL